MVLRLRYQTGQCSSLLDESEDKWDGDDLRGFCLDRECVTALLEDTRAELEEEEVEGGREGRSEDNDDGVLMLGH